MTKAFLTELTYKIIGAAIEVHKTLGPGLLESVYHQCLAHEFNLQGIAFRSEMYVPVYYKDIEVETHFRCDFLVEDAIVVEIKAIVEILPIHIAFLMNYMKLLESPKGIMLNFHCVNLFKEGQKTYVNQQYRSLPDE